MREYEMRLLRPSGVLSVVMKTLAVDDYDARRMASQYLIGDIASACIFSGDKAVGVVQRALGVQNREHLPKSHIPSSERTAVLVA